VNKLLLAVFLVGCAASPVRSVRQMADMPPPVTVPGLPRNCAAAEARDELTSVVAEVCTFATGAAGLAAIFKGRELNEAQQIGLGAGLFVAGACAAGFGQANAHARAAIDQCREDAAATRLDAVKEQLDKSIRGVKP